MASIAALVSTVRVSLVAVALSLVAVALVSVSFGAISLVTVALVAVSLGAITLIAVSLRQIVEVFMEFYLYSNTSRYYPTAQQTLFLLTVLEEGLILLPTNCSCCSSLECLLGTEHTKIPSQNSVHLGQNI